MPRVKGSAVTRRRRKKILKLAKGYFGSKRTLYRTAHEQVMRSLAYSYRDRKQRKREFRKLWISRINAAAKLHDSKYSTLIYGLSLANVTVNRKMLADIAVHEPADFKAYVDLANQAIADFQNGKPAAPKVVAKPSPKKEAPKKEEPKPEVIEEQPVVEKPKPAPAPKKKVIVDEEDPTVVYETDEEIELASMLATALRDRAVELGIEGADTMRKAQLIKSITNIPNKENVPYEKLLIGVLRDKARERGIENVNKKLKVDLIKELYATDPKK